MEERERREKIFIENYLTTKSPTQAAIAAGYSPAHANSTGSKIMQRKHVKDEIDRRLEEKFEVFRLEADSIKKILEDAATLDLTELVTMGRNGVELKAFETMPKHLRVLITEITNTPTKHGTKVNFKVFSKEKAVELLARIFGLDKTPAVQVNFNLAQIVENNY